MDITGTLAKLLATENLTVQHSGSAQTASFNVKDRILTLPVFQEASQEVMTMLAAHEVGHALQTPADWAEQVAEAPRSTSLTLSKTSVLRSLSRISSPV